MADLTASEVTVVSSVQVGSGEGHGYRIVQYYLDHTFVTADELLAATLGVEAVIAVLNASFIDASNAPTEENTEDLTITLENRLDVGRAASGTSATLTLVGDDSIVFPAAVNTFKGCLLTCLVKS